jgi:putative hydrolase of the HAD superfamily
MRTRVISLDLWGTIFDFNTEILASEHRRELVKEFAAEQGVEDMEFVDKTYEATTKYFYERYESDAVTLTPRQRLSHQLKLIGVEADGARFDRLVEDVQGMIVDHPPPLAANLRSALAALSARFALVIVSDTGFSPGSSIRKVFKKHGIDGYFRDYSFSDENGKSKPDPHAFMSVLRRVNASPSEFLHIGDTEWSDIRGAKSLGGRACLYVGITDRWLAGTEADYVLHDWGEISDLIDCIERSESGVA